MSADATGTNKQPTAHSAHIRLHRVLTNGQLLVTLKDVFCFNVLITLPFKFVNIRFYASCQITSYERLLRHWEAHSQLIPQVLPRANANLMELGVWSWCIHTTIEIVSSKPTSRFATIATTICQCYGTEPGLRERTTSRPLLIRGDTFCKESLGCLAGRTSWRAPDLAHTGGTEASWVAENSYYDRIGPVHLRRHTWRSNDTN